jgi:hypothetical protein
MQAHYPRHSGRDDKRRMDLMFENKGTKTEHDDLLLANATLRSDNDQLHRSLERSNEEIKKSKIQMALLADEVHQLKEQNKFFESHYANIYPALKSIQDVIIHKQDLALHTNAELVREIGKRLEKLGEM